ncbi:MAG: glycerophosphodiester phosphodiesterase [Ramlibacter sp.]|jgi:glycerophosphoryl diester phosphodiesterase|uniref:glycerophosphodiester phosphodiesterase n=1 Tax=Ramlibacter sp. TaxID=1917967 RepID=UPI002611935F|nr:glycerophosphodiester phosphodiesterase [Ramlibacter sp.]MDB5751176.1 glycerophosphodiester phosphodiesterase [Ramlibacter sp.]
MKDWPYPRWIAHRGAGKLAPENTLAAFRLGATHGFRMFECDVKLGADNIPFLLHDDKLDRTTNGIGTAGDHTWDQLGWLDAGSWHSRMYAGEPIPAFENIARWCLANKYFLDIEIKPSRGREAETGDVVARHAARLWEGQPVPPFLTSFQPESLRAAQLAAPQLPRGLLLDKPHERWLEGARELECVAIVCNHKLWTAETVRQAKQAGFRCLSYTVNEPAEAERLFALGTDGIVTDRVDLFPPG